MGPSKRKTLPAEVGGKKGPLDYYFRSKLSLPGTSSDSSGGTNNRPSIETMHPKIRLSDTCLPTVCFFPVSIPSAAKRRKVNDKRREKPKTSNTSSDIIFLSSDDDDDEGSNSGDCDGVQILAEISNNFDPRTGNKMSAHDEQSTTTFPDDIIKGLLVSDDFSEDQVQSSPDKENFIDLSQFLEVIVNEDGKSVDSPRSGYEASDYKFTLFRDIIDTVLRDPHNEHLFNESDRELISSFTCLSVPAQRLYIRLFLRKHKWIRGNNIKYPDIDDDCNALLNELTNAGFILPFGSITNLSEALEALDLDDVKRCAKEVLSTSVSGDSKSSLVQSIIDHAKSSHDIRSHFNGQRVTAEEVVLNHLKNSVQNTPHKLVKEATGLFSRMTYLFYPPQVNEDENGVATSHEFFNEKKIQSGYISYPKYSVEKKEMIYRERQDLVDYSDACHLEGQVLSSLEKKDKELQSHLLLQVEKEYDRVMSSAAHHDKNLPVFLRNQTAGHVLTRCLSHLVASLEQAKKYEAAVSCLRKLLSQDVYCHNFRGVWYERLVIDLQAHMKRPIDASNELSKGLQDPLVKVFLKYNLYHRAKKMNGKRAGLSRKKIPDEVLTEFSNAENFKSTTIFADTLKKSIEGRQTIFVDGSNSPIPVEEAALIYYKSREKYPDGLHCESLVYHSLLNILLWDVIYAPVPDAFRFAHQILPLDFVSEQFYLRRKEMIDARLESLIKMSGVEVNEEIEKVWTEHKNTQCLFYWNKVSTEILKELVYCISMPVLAKIFKRMMSNFRLNRSGFPDLIVWDAKNKRVKAIEVKGPGDSLSGKQILWLKFFTDSGLPCEVCYVKAK